jgi:hypothetical protein
MEAVRESWSDDRIDGLELKVEEGFRHVDRRFEQVDKRFEQVDKRFEQVDSRLERIEQEMSTRFAAFEVRFQSLEDGLRSFHRTQVTLFVGLFGSFIALICAVLTVMLTQL